MDPLFVARFPAARSAAERKAVVAEWRTWKKTRRRLERELHRLLLDDSQDGSKTGQGG
jgi:hypothetical protein